MATFESWTSFFGFANSVTRDWRYVRDERQRDFLAAVLETSRSRREQLDEGTILWRAQICHEWITESVGDGEEETFPSPASLDRMKPKPDRATEGRANPRGIPHLYLATHEETAVAEVRPWVGSLVSVARVQLLRSVTVVNCTTDDHGFRVYFEEPDPEAREKAVWRDIDRAFSRPVTMDEGLPEYVPTQVLAEVFRSDGADGIAYRSALGPGHNIALFALDMADVVSCSLVSVKSVEFQYDQASSYVVTKSSVNEEAVVENETGSGSA